MSDDSTITPATPRGFPHNLSRPGFTRPGPSDEAMASLDAAMARGPMETTPGNHRKLRFSKWDRWQIRAAHRAGAIDVAELDQPVWDPLPHSASRWPAADLLIELHDAPEKQTRTVIRLQVRDGLPLPFRFSAFVNLMEPGLWLAVEPFLLSRHDAVHFERPPVLDDPLVYAAIVFLHHRIISAVGLVSERHQRLTATRH